MRLESIAPLLTDDDGVVTDEEYDEPGLDAGWTACHFLLPSQLILGSTLVAGREGILQNSKNKTLGLKRVSGVQLVLVGAPLYLLSSQLQLHHHQPAALMDATGLSQISETNISHYILSGFRKEVLGWPCSVVSSARQKGPASSC